MANTAVNSRKRPIAQASEPAQGGSETFGQDGRRARNPSKRQQDINNDLAVRLQAKVDRQKAKLAKQQQKLAKYGELNANENEDSDLGLESQEEEDMGRGARAGGGFTSIIASKGTVQHGRSVVPRRLVLETNCAPGEQRRQALDVDHSQHGGPSVAGDHDDDNDTPQQWQRPSSPSTNSSRSSSPTRHERATMPLSPRIRHEQSPPGPPPSPTPSQLSPHMQPEHTPPPPQSTHTRREHTTRSPSSRHATQTLSSRHATQLSSRHATQTPSSPRSEMNDSSFLPPCKRTKLAPAPFRQGCTLGPKPKAADYEDGIKKMLLNAMHEYACLILTVEAFPNEEKQTQWAKTTWLAACEEAGQHFECSSRMIRLITGRGSWARGFLKDAARVNFKVFKFKEGSTNEVKLYNQNLRQSLLCDDAFHHKNQADVTGFGEHRIIIDILRDALFEDTKSYGVKYSRYFNPISINLLALVFTMIKFLIDEWSTGERVKATFRSRSHLETFEAHHLRTEQWCELEPTVTTNIRKRMYKTLMKKAGASPNKEGGAVGMTQTMRERAKEALAGRTGETDDEDD